MRVKALTTILLGGALTLTACGSPSPEEALIDAVRDTSATDVTDSGIIASAGMACEMGGMAPIMFLGPMTDKGMTNDEADEVLPYFQAYCKSL